MRRARHTAESVNAGLNKPTISINNLRECRFGIYEGQPSNGPWRDEWVRGGSLPGAETHDAYVNWAAKGLDEALTHPGPVLVVAHGGTFWAIQRFALYGQLIRVPNCVLLKLDPPQDEKNLGPLLKLLPPMGHHLPSEKVDRRNSKI